MFSNCERFASKLLCGTLVIISYSLHQTCTALYEASKARSIWLNLCRDYLAPSVTFPQILHLERPLWMYNAQELEFLFLRLQGAEIGWRRDDNPPARSRTVTSANEAIGLWLVEGGRWLLVVSQTGSVTYLDLDSPIITEAILIPDQIDDPAPMVWRDIRLKMAIDMDRTSPFLAFNIAFSLCSFEDARPGEHKIQIWHVDLVLDERQRGVGLTCKHVATFPLETDVYLLNALSLLGPHLAFSVHCLGYEEPEKTFIVDWYRANGMSNYPRRLIHPAHGPVS